MTYFVKAFLTAIRLLFFFFRLYDYGRLFSSLLFFFDDFRFSRFNGFIFTSLAFSRFLVFLSRLPFLWRFIALTSLFLVIELFQFSKNVCFVVIRTAFTVFFLLFLAAAPEFYASNNESVGA